MKPLTLTVLFCLFLLGCAKHDSSITSTDPQLNLDAPASPLTAKYRHDAIQTQVAGLGSEYQLRWVSSQNVTIAGLSKDWSYVYRGKIVVATFMETLCYMRSCNDTVRYDSVSTARAAMGIATISQKWMNSDVALSIAEKNGGAEFRKKNQGYVIEASIGEGGCVPNSHPTWFIVYKSLTTDACLRVNIDATSGVLQQ